VTEPTPADEQPAVEPEQPDVQPEPAPTPPPPPPAVPVPVGDKSDLVAEAMRRNRGLASYDAWAMTETDLTKLLEG